ncbi:protein SCO1/2 [Saonia flava]|uniref:Protein SCO1/2 n=1 Tax=Saonia flava TaxID=523696 RepID=A0A846QS35_9FLAO|nr:SCO family protein [Saonia flava]NJB70941.1 protein SCO1/2 [Saonia flava]
MNKGKYTYVWVSFVILVFGIIFIPKIIDRIQNGSVVENDRINLKDTTDELSYLIIDGKKRRVPQFALLNQDSLLISDKDYIGKVYVAEFFFTSCPTICPLMTKNLVEIQNEFKVDSDFGIVSFTINPRYDSPRVLKEYAEKYNITDLDWHLLTGEQEKIYELANKGFNIFADENPEVPGGFEHSGMFALIDKKGYIRSRVDSYGNPIIYYRGTISETEGQNDEGEKEQISILKEDIKKLLQE